MIVLFFEQQSAEFETGVVLCEEIVFCARTADECSVRSMTAC